MGNAWTSLGALDLEELFNANYGTFFLFFFWIPYIVTLLNHHIEGSHDMFCFGFKVNGYTSMEFSFISLGNRGKLLKEKNGTRSLRRASSSREADQKSQKLFPLGEKTWKYAHTHEAGLPRSGKNIWKMKFFPGQGKVREIYGWPGKLGKSGKSQGI